MQGLLALEEIVSAEVCVGGSKTNVQARTTVKYPSSTAIGEGKFSAVQATAAARLFVACGTSYEKTVEALMYGHQYWTGEAVQGDDLPSEATLSNWVLAVGQAALKQLGKARVWISRGLL